MKTIVCYGDLNTWGYAPATSTRYDIHTRWPGVLRNSLGSGWWVIEEGLNGRTTVHDDPLEPGRCGKTYLSPCLLTHKPFDILILMLGTNDLKRRFDLPPSDIALGAQALAEIVLASDAGIDDAPPAVVLICPPPLAPLGGTRFEEMFEGGYEKSLKLSAYYRAAAEELGCHFIDAGKVVTTSPDEGLHWEAQEHGKLGAHVAAYVREHFG